VTAVVVPGKVWFTLLIKERFLNKFFVAIFRVVDAVQSGDVPRYNLVSIPPSTPYDK